MVDSPWNKNKLTRGQVEQRLKSLRCTFVKEPKPGSAIWNSPTGHPFSISYDDCPADLLDAIVAQIKKWNKED